MALLNGFKTTVIVAGELPCACYIDTPAIEQLLIILILVFGMHCFKPNLLLY